MIDAHAHIQMPPLISEWEALVSRAEAAGVEGVVVVGESMESSRAALELCRTRRDLYPVVGVHPEHAGELSTEEGKERMEGMTNSKLQMTNQIQRSTFKVQNAVGRVHAIGEIGLDYHWIDSADPLKKKEQREAFEWQIDLANRNDLPIVIHSRDAAEDTLEILKKHPPRYALMHCYSYDIKTAEVFLAMNPSNMIAFTGILTFPNAKALREICQAIPLERMLTESDCPHLAPQQYRGKQNEPAYIVEIVKEIAELKGIAFTEVASQTAKNAREFFGIL